MECSRAFANYGSAPTETHGLVRIGVDWKVLQCGKQEHRTADKNNQPGHRAAGGWCRAAACARNSVAISASIRRGGTVRVVLASPIGRCRYRLERNGELRRDVPMAGSNNRTATAIVQHLPVVLLRGRTRRRQRTMVRFASVTIHTGGFGHILVIAVVGR